MIFIIVAPGRAHHRSTGGSSAQIEFLLLHTRHHSVTPLPLLACLFRNFYLFAIRYNLLHIFAFIATKRVAIGFSRRQTRELTMRLRISRWRRDVKVMLTS